MLTKPYLINIMIAKLNSSDPVALRETMDGRTDFRVGFHGAQRETAALSSFEKERGLTCVTVMPPPFWGRHSFLCEVC